jgi:hypothetical protein
LEQTKVGFIALNKKKEYKTTTTVMEANQIQPEAKGHLAYLINPCKRVVATYKP